MSKYPAYCKAMMLLKIYWLSVLSML
uniref:TOR n=1 Tax=Arundo donax TaxID=35708 RepID=A0A0A9DTY8_ARUDO